jgi:hypothetical protein
MIIRASLADAYERLRAATPGPIDLSSFWFEALPLLQRADEPVGEVAAEYRRRWAAILDCPLELPAVRYSARELADRVGEAFPGVRSGWGGARYVSPDVMIATRSVDAIAQGDVELVLGECHLAVNALRHSCFVAQHPEPRRLLEATNADFPRRRLLAALPRDNPPKVRLHSGLIRPTDVHVTLIHQTVDPMLMTVVPAADLTVERGNGGPVARLGSGERFDVMELFGELLTDRVLDSLKVFGTDHAHTPRVNFDRLVVARETWRFTATEIAFVRDADETARFVGARRWWRDIGLPRQVFVKTPLEPKPFYVDFGSPFYVNIFAKAVRRLGREDTASAPGVVSVTEMLPTPEQAWLTDHDGQRYTSELRLAAIDLRDAADSAD